MKRKCNHQFFMSCGGESVFLGKNGMRTNKIKGKGIYCIKCGYRPKENETPQVLKDFSGLIEK